MAAAKTTGRPTSNGGPPEAAVPSLVLDRIEVETLLVPILGTSPLLMNRFSEKAKRQMLDAMQGRKTPKQAKDPKAEYEAAFYRFEDGGIGFPVIAFKSATVGAARFYGKSVKMTELRQFVFVRGEIGVDGKQLARIVGEAEMSEDVVRVGNGGTDLRYRPLIREWSTSLQVTYVTSALTRESLLGLVDAGGLGVGIGEWRPERKGDFGTYCVDQDRDVDILS
jgi:hypothetical protein